MSQLNKMIRLTQRQFNILEFVRKQGGASNRELKMYLKDISRATIVRDLDVLLRQNLIQRSGKGRNIHYLEKVRSELLRYIDVEEYFQKGPDERKIKWERFNFEIFQKLTDVFEKEELKDLEKLNNAYRKRIKKLSSTILKKEFERLTIELSWKSSRIEGNTYSLLDTEILIKEHKEAEGHKKEEAIMILNHKKALDYILDKKSDFKTITLAKIQNIHDLIVADLSVEKGLRKRPVGVVGTRYRPLDNVHQVKEAMEKFIVAVNMRKDSFSKSLIAILLISYIQPFEDGNKRTARLLGNALLVAHHACPLSFRSVDEGDYKKATLLFYEQNNIRFFKELFVDQFKFAMENYFLG